jgi:hypothetical protein
MRLGCLSPRYARFGQAAGSDVKTGPTRRAKPGREEPVLSHRWPAGPIQRWRKVSTPYRKLADRRIARSTPRIQPYLLVLECPAVTRAAGLFVEKEELANLPPA